MDIVRIPKKKIPEDLLPYFKLRKQNRFILRNILVWHKPNAMPSSVKDRFSNNYEPVFMLVKKKKYWFDLDAVRQKYADSPEIYKKKAKINPTRKGYSDNGYIKTMNTYSGDRTSFGEQNPAGKNPGDVWKIATQPFPEAHFATFPERLVEPMIKSSCPQWICKKCGKARVRIIKRERPETYNPSSQDPRNKGRGKMSHHRPLKEIFRDVGTSKTIGWTNCSCNTEWKAGIVLDPFLGSGTTALVARKLGRNWIGIELSKTYIKIAEKRLAQQSLFEKAF